MTAKLRPPVLSPRAAAALLALARWQSLPADERCIRRMRCRRRHPDIPPQYVDALCLDDISRSPEGD